MGWRGFGVFAWVHRRERWRINIVEYLTIQEVAADWNLSIRRLQAICASGRIEGAKKFGSCWAIPSDAKNPEDLRVKSRKYIKKK